MQEQIKQNNFMGKNIEEVSFFLKSTKELLGHVQVVMKSDTNTTFRVRVNFFYNSQFFVENYPLLCLWGDPHFAKVIFFFKKQVMLGLSNYTQWRQSCKAEGAAAPPIILEFIKYK